MTNQSSVRKEGNGFYEEFQGVKILHLKGKPYDIGFQHGALISEKIIHIVPLALDAAAGVISKTINISPETAKQRMLSGKEAARPYIPEEYLEEMQGIADGVSARGSRKMDLEEIILWNTMYDQWCLYAHPNPSDAVKARSNEEKDSNVLSTAGCSSFSAWGKAVEGDMLIFGKNMDNLNLPSILDNRILVIVDPDEGISHAFITHSGMIGIDGGLNTSGITMMTQYDAFADETLEGCGIGTLSRLLLTRSQTIDQAITILKDFPHCTGIAFHVTDANANKAAIVNASATQVHIRYPREDQDVLFTSNHTNCYPGWYGYEGYNMVNDQKQVYTLTDVSTIENWQKSLRDPENVWVPAPSRFERYEQLMNEHYGKINIETAQAVLSDRYDPYTKRTREKDAPSESNNTLATICALYKDDIYFEDIPSKKFSAHVSNLWSMVMTPGNGDFWLAINDFPAQYGGYIHFNLNQELLKHSHTS